MRGIYEQKQLQVLTDELAKKTLSQFALQFKKISVVVALNTELTHHLNHKKCI